MSGASSSIKNGQTIQLKSGANVINANDLVQVGGPGNMAFPVISSDFASRSAVGVIPSTLPSASANAANNYARWASASDTLGNIYVATPGAIVRGISVTKFTPAGVQIGNPVVLDATADSMESIRIGAIPGASGPTNTFLICYADSTNAAIKFVIFDSNLSLISGPTTVGTGYPVGGVVYTDFCFLAGGAGFAIVYENNAHTQVLMQTYSNIGTPLLAATNVQSVTGTGLIYFKIAQLNNGNVVVVMRGTGTPAGTSFVIVNSGTGANVVANTVVDSVSTAGFVELAVLSSGLFFAVADMNGTNVKAAVYSQAGAIQGTAYSGTSTLNNTTYNQIRLIQDGINFYLFFTVTAGGLQVVQLNTAGASLSMPSIVDTSTFATGAAFDASISNNMAVLFSSSSGTAGQKYVVLGLPDASLGIVYPYILAAAVAVGTAAGTTGGYWPSCRATGDFTAIVVYDQQSPTNIFMGIIKFAASSIQGVAQNPIAINQSGSTLTVNPGPASYPVNQVNGTPALVFDHSNAVPSGNKGEIYPLGVSLSAPATIGAAGGGSLGYIRGINNVTDSFDYVPLCNVNIMVTLTQLSSGTGGVTLAFNNGPTINLFQAGATQSVVNFSMNAGQKLTIALTTGTATPCYLLTATRQL